MVLDVILRVNYIQMKMRMRGRPKNVPDQPIQKKYGEFIISFE